MKIAESRELLASGKKVAEAAQLLGYENVSHFSKMFKRYYGQSPRCLRGRRNQGSNPVNRS